jgi:hypothetical protein
MHVLEQLEPMPVEYSKSCCLTTESKRLWEMVPGCQFKVQATKPQVTVAIGTAPKGFFFVPPATGKST